MLANSGKHKGVTLWLINVFMTDQRLTCMRCSAYSSNSSYKAKNNDQGGAFWAAGGSAARKRERPYLHRGNWVLPCNSSAPLWLGCERSEEYKISQRLTMNMDFWLRSPPLWMDLSTQGNTCRCKSKF